MVVVESGSGTTGVSGAVKPGPSIDELIGFIKGISPGAILPVSGGDEVEGTCDKVDGRQVVDGDEDEDEVVDVECTGSMFCMVGSLLLLFNAVVFVDEAIAMLILLSCASLAFVISLYW